MISTIMNKTYSFCKPRMSPDCSPDCDPTETRLWPDCTLVTYPQQLHISDHPKPYRSRLNI